MNTGVSFFSLSGFFSALIFTVAIGIFIASFLTWWKATRPKGNSSSHEVKRQKIDSAIALALEHTTLSRSQEIAIDQILEILHEILQSNRFSEYRRSVGYYYAERLERIGEIVTEYSLPHQVMKTAIEFIYEGLKAQKKDPGPVFDDLSKFMKKLEQGS